MQYWLMAFLIVSCDGPYTNPNRKIFENTSEFLNRQDTAKVSFVKAKEIFQKYHNENEFKKLETLFYYFQDDYYFFGYHTDPLRDKENKVWYFLEAKISAETGALVKLNESIDWKENNDKK
ncbi:MAG: hypothetical protein EOP54_14320 [Sphingobacteriales bacterium]|nr:MAG: hypothetical protein EOP54_14320 [Sphingobacteriales bacterium]